MRRVCCEILWITLIALLCASASAVLHPDLFRDTTEGDPRVLALSNVLDWPEPPIWIDARPRTRYEKAHIPGAVLLNEDEWDELVPGVLQRWSPGRRIVVYCDDATCGASREVADRIRNELGLEDVYVLKGGWRSWTKAATTSG